MTLHVPLDRFATSAEKFTETREVYVTSHGTGAIASAGNPSKGALVVSVSELSVADTKARLASAGLTVNDGCWEMDSMPKPEVAKLTQEFHVAAVAYSTDNHQPGVWVDAFGTQPTPVQVLRAMYDEFVNTGEVGDVSFEEFVRLSNANVAVVSPTELKTFLDAKNGNGHKPA